MIRKALWLWLFLSSVVAFQASAGVLDQRQQHQGPEIPVLNVDLQGGTELAIFDELWPLRLAQRLQETLVKGLSLPRGHGQVEVRLVALEDVLQGGLAESTSYCLSITLFGQCFPLSASNTCRFKIFWTMCSSSFCVSSREIPSNTPMTHLMAPTCSPPTAMLAWVTHGTTAFVVAAGTGTTLLSSVHLYSNPQEAILTDLRAAVTFQVSEPLHLPFPLPVMPSPHTALCHFKLTLHLKGPNPMSLPGNPP